MTAPRTATVHGLEIAYLELGPQDGPLALLLHGFPDTPVTWRHLAPALADTGYHAVMPWLRGYAPTAVPSDGAYQGGAYVRDALGLAQAVGGDAPGVLIGHDVGASIAYGAAALEPARWSHVVTLSVPPLPVLGQLLAGYDQLKRSWYTFAFQHPAAETLVGLGDLVFLDRLWQDWSPEVDAPALAAAKESLRAPGALAAALGWYRAGMHPELDDPAYAAEQAALVASPSQPWLYLHGAQDGCVLPDAAALVPESLVIEEAGHFPQLERPQRVTDAVLDHVRAASPARA